MVSKDKIDFVILWVNGDDKNWQKEYLKHRGAKGGETDLFRYRDWGFLPFWFRAIENYTPWVNKIHFITCGHTPDWLNVNHPKLNLVEHRDYIDSEFLPTFNSNVIELNLHKIESLTEKFVLFNDDTFVINKVKPEFFFKNNLPMDFATQNIQTGLGISNTIINNLVILNKSFTKKEVLKKYFFKFFNIKYGVNLLRSLAVLPWPRFSGFKDPHLPQPFLKSTFIEIWDKYPKELESTSNNKFRSCNDLSQYLMRYWQLVSGKFTPTKSNGKFLEIDNSTNHVITESIISNKYKTICLNDGEIEDFISKKELILNAFSKKLPSKSNFEI